MLFHYRACVSILSSRFLASCVVSIETWLRRYGFNLSA